MFNFALRTPLTGCSQLAVTCARTKGEVTATTLVGRAWTWVSTSFVAPVAVVATTGTKPAPGSLRLLAARPPISPTLSHTNLRVHLDPIRADMRSRRDDQCRRHRATFVHGLAYDRLWRIEEAHVAMLMRDHTNTYVEDRDRFYGFACGSEWYDEDE